MLQVRTVYKQFLELLPKHDLSLRHRCYANPLDLVAISARLAWRASAVAVYIDDLIVIGQLPDCVA